MKMIDTLAIKNIGKELLNHWHSLRMKQLKYESLSRTMRR